MRLKVVVACAIIFASACGGEDGAPAGERPSSTATIQITSPESGDVLEPGPLEIGFDLEGGTIVEESSTELTPDTGHVHIKLDGTTLTQTYGEGETIELPGDDARHLIEAEFVAADHGPFNPRVISAITIEVAS